jgi:hypothetical protein
MTTTTRRARRRIAGHRPDHSRPAARRTSSRQIAPVLVLHRPAEIAVNASGPDHSASDTRHARNIAAAIALLVALGGGILLATFTGAFTPTGQVSPIGHVWAKVRAATDPWPITQAAKDEARICAVWASDPTGRIIANPDYDQTRCTALSVGSTNTYLATIPTTEEPHIGTCPLATRRACRASLGLPQTMDTAAWWAPWEAPNGTARTLVNIALCAVLGLIVAISARASLRRCLLAGALLGLAWSSPALHIPALESRLSWLGLGIGVALAAVLLPRHITPHLPPPAVLRSRLRTHVTGLPRRLAIAVKGTPR